MLWGVIGCSSESGSLDKVPQGGVLLSGAGSTFDSVLFASWFTTYQNDHPKDVITYDVVGSGEGVRRFIGRSLKQGERIDFGASDSAMRDDEIAQAGQEILMVPVTASGIVLAYNLPDLEADLRLSRDAYVGIFLGEITNWNDKRIAKSNPGVKLPDLTITTVVRQDASGTTYAFTKHLDAISEAWRARYGPATLVNWPGNAMRAPGNEGVAAKVKQSIGSIGYIGYEFSRKLILRTAILENREGRFVKMTEQSCIAALTSAQMPENLRIFVPDPVGPSSYPIVTYSWILLRRNNPDATKANVIRDLFRWCLQDGQRYAPGLGYVPLPTTVAAKALSTLDSITPGQ